MARKPMNTARSRVSFLVALLALGALASCKPTTADGTDLRESLRDVDVQGYFYAKVDDDIASTESLTNPAVAKLTPLDKSTTKVVLGYKRVHDKRANTTKTYRAETLRSGNDISLVVTDIATNEVVVKDRFPPPQPHADGFDTLQECINDFFCKEGAALQCEANRTCKAQFAALICCLKNGTCFSVHLIIRPNRLRCFLVDLIPDLEGIVLQ